MMKLLSVVIIYNPEIKLLQDNIRQFIEEVNELIVWDNTPGGTNGLDQIFSSFPQKHFERIKYLGDGINHCIAYPLNRVVEYALANNYTHLLTMDQDSLFENNSFSLYVQLIKDYQPQSIVSMFGVNYNHQFQISDSIYAVKDVITSGTIYVLDVLRILGPFREDYEIDGVDSEMCFRAIKQGMSVMMVSNIILNQQFGHIERKRLGYHIDNYSAFRIYHIVRNNIYMWREYPVQYKSFRYDFIKYNIVIRIPKIIFHEKSKFRKIKALLLGIVDGILGKYSKRKI